ncbi:hypothetical protein [Geothrix terrae]|uniref:hypothetical protein n=1 Tax=Geothrix terrae TaxID=2922720 RepID=UPI001FAC21D9|nr:hypothetical protein [Geothrix terrae]
MLSFRTKTCVLMICATSLSYACSVPQAKSLKSMITKPGPSVEQVDDWVTKATALFEGKSLADLRKLAKLKRETKSKRPFYDGDSNSLQDYLTLEFDGLTIGGFPSKGSFLIEEVSITSSAWPVLDGLVVGSDASVVPTIFGFSKRPLIAPQELFSGFVHSLVVHSAKGIITKVQFFYFFD